MEDETYPLGGRRRPAFDDFSGESRERIGLAFDLVQAGGSVVSRAMH